MDNKYYTPTIEEFHVGFEYEAKERFTDGTVKTKDEFDNAKWVKSVADAGLMYIERALTGKNNDNGLCGIRVKFLDKEDIESFGWEKFGNNFRKENLFLLFNLDKSVVIIDGNYPKFSGKIKNKSELKKLMQQLGINV